MARVIILVLFAVMLNGVQASSYFESVGKYHHEGVTLHVAFADVYNIRKDSETGEVKHIHYANTTLRLDADKDCLVKNGANLTIKDKKHPFLGSKKEKDHFATSEKIVLESHMHEFVVSYTVIKPGTTDPVTVTKHLIVTRDEKDPLSKLVVKEKPQEKKPEKKD